MTGGNADQGGGVSDGKAWGSLHATLCVTALAGFHPQFSAVETVTRSLTAITGDARMV